MRRIVLLATFVISIGFLCFEANSQEIEIYGEGAKVIRHSNVELSRRQKGNFGEMSRTGYFSAMAVIPNSQISGWAYLHHSLQSARAFALEGCRMVAPDYGLDPSKCVLYASVIPKRASPSDASLSGLSEPGGELFSRYMSVHEPGLYGAFAISSLSDVGAVPNARTAKEARDGALQTCRNAFAEGSAGWTTEMRRWVSSKGYDKCRVVHEFRP